MIKIPPDYTFVRDDIPLSGWLERLVHFDAAVRAVAGDMLGAMWQGVPRPDTDWANLDPLPDTTAQTERFTAAVKATVAAMPDSADYSRRLTAYLITVHCGFQKEIRGQTEADEARFDKYVFKARKHLDVMNSNAADAEKSKARKALKRLSTALFRGICGDCTPHEAISQAGLLASIVFDAMNELHLRAPEIFDWLLDEDHQRYKALKVLEAIGPPAVAFAPRLLREMEARRPRNARNDVPRALGSISRGQPELIEKLIRNLQNEDPELRSSAANALIAAADDLCGRESVILGFLETRLKAGWSLFELYARVGSNDAAVRARVLQFARPQGPRMERWGHPGVEHLCDVANFERGYAISTLRHFAAYADECLPTLIAALDDFEEFDPDHGYNGPKERIANVLEAFGAAGATAAVPLARHLRDPDGEYPKAILDALAAMGTGAMDALSLVDDFRNEGAEEPLPDLETKPADKSEDHAGWAIQKIRGR